MPNVAVEKNRLILNGISYFRGNADTVELGSIGEKRTPLFGQNYLQVKDKILISSNYIDRPTVVDIDSTKISKNTFGTGVTAIIKGVSVALNSDATFEQIRDAKLKLVKFSVTPFNMKTLANSSSKLQSLKEWGNDARIAHQVFVVMEADLANEVRNVGNTSISAGTNGIVVTIGSNSSISVATRITISKDTCFAYLLAKIEWDAKLKKRRKKIVDLEDDQWSFS